MPLPMPTRFHLALWLLVPVLTGLAPLRARGDEEENRRRLRSMPREQRLVLDGNLKRFDALDRETKAGLRSIDEELAKLPSENRVNYESVLRRYRLWALGLPKEQQEQLRSTPPEQRLALVTKLRGRERSGPAATTPLFLQIAELNAPSPFYLAHILKVWFELAPADRAALEHLAPNERRNRLTELGKKVKVAPTERLTKPGEDKILEHLQANPQLKARLARLADAKNDDQRHRLVDNYYFIEHPPPKVEAENLMKFDAALPSWFRAPFDHLPPEETRRRLTDLYRLVFPAGHELPANLKTTATTTATGTATTAGGPEAQPRPAPPAPAPVKPSKPAPGPPTPAGTASSPF